MTLGECNYAVENDCSPLSHLKLLKLIYRPSTSV